MTVGIATLAFNNEDFIRRQYALFKRLCTDTSEFVVIDNSDFAMSPDCGDVVLPVPNRRHHPESHRWALKYATEEAMVDYDAVLLIDHDVFPVKKFSVEDLLRGRKTAGVRQARPEIDISYFYYAPWVFAYRKGVKPDFWTVIEGADTGCGTWPLVAKGADMSEILCDVYPGGPVYTFVADTFVHFINGSNWRRDDDHNERMATLHALVDRLVGGG